MKYSQRAFWRWLGRKLRGQFLAGVITVVPIAVTILILVWLFTTIDNILQPIIETVWGHPVTGVGFGITIVLIYVIGVIASNVIGKRIIQFFESGLPWMPGVRQLYNGIKQILVGFSAPRTAGFMQVVLIEFPRKGIWTVGFVTNETSGQSGQTQLNIFIPTSPNPTSGFLQITTEDEVIRTDIPVDEALKMIISAGKVSPREVSDKLSGRIK